MSTTSRLVVGLQPVREAIRVHRSKLAQVLVDSRRTPRLDAIARFARDQDVADVRRVTTQQLDRIAMGVEHQGVAAYAPPLPLVDFDALVQDEHLLALALDEIQDPQNFGAVVRCAVAIAGAAVIWGEHASAPLSPAMFRTSAGAVEQARLCRVSSLRDSLQRLTQTGVQVVGLDARASTALHEMPLSGPTVLVVGSEHRGLGRGVRSVCSGFASLLSSGKLESLNASVAAGIALHTVLVSRMKSNS